MSKEEHDFLKPGEYKVELTLWGSYKVDEGDEITEDEVLNWVRRHSGEMVDWEVEKL